SKRDLSSDVCSYDLETMIFLDSIDKKIIHFKELGIYRYGKLMYKKNIAEQYRNEKLLKLMQHDINNNSALLRTLWYYLKMDAKRSEERRVGKDSLCM